MNRKILTLVLTSRVQPVPGPELRARLGMSKPALSYHIKKLTHAGLIRCLFRDGCNFYQATDKARALGVKNPSWGMIDPVLGLHNIAFKWKILRGQNFSLEKTTQMRGWVRHHGYLHGCFIVKTPGSLIVWPIKNGERMVGKDAFSLLQQARDKAIVLAQELVNRYDLELQGPLQCRRPHYGIQDPAAKAIKAAGVQISTRDFQVDSSPGTEGELDALTPEAANNYLKLPAQVQALQTQIEELQALQRGGLSTLQALANTGNVQAAITKILTQEMSAIKKVADRMDRRLSQRTIGEFASRRRPPREI